MGSDLGVLLRRPAFLASEVRSAGGMHVACLSSPRVIRASFDKFTYLKVELRPPPLRGSAL